MSSFQPDGEVVDSVDAVFEAAENKPVTALQKVVAETAGEDIVAGTAGHSPDA